MSSAPNVTRRHFRGSLARTMLLMLLPLSMAPLLVMGSMAYLRARVLLRDQIFTVMSAAADAQSQRIVSEVQTGTTLISRALFNIALIADLDTVLTVSPDDPAFLSARLDLLNALQSLNSPKPVFNQYLIVRTDGTVVAATKNAWEGLILDDASLFYEPNLPASAGGTTSRAFISPKQLYGENDQSLTLVTTFAYEMDGQIAAYVFAITESTILRDWMKNAGIFTALQAPANHYYVTTQGQFFRETPYPNSITKLVEVNPPTDYRERVRNGLISSEAQGVFEVTSFNDQPIISAYTRLPGLDLGWVTEVAQADVYRQISSMLWSAILIFGGAFVLLAVILYQVTQRMVQPIQKLTQTVQLFAEGHWEQRFQSDRKDEIGLLADSFNQMANELTGLYHSLEQKVEERTRQVRAVTDVSQSASSATNLDELFRVTIDMVSRRYGFHYSAIYFMENPEIQEQRFLVLRQAKGAPDMSNRLSGKPVQVDARSLIGWCAAFIRPRADAPDGSFSSPYPLVDDRRQDLLPDTRSEAAVPITLGGQVLAVFYVQSIIQNQFNDDTLEELRALLNQIAPAMRNIQILETTQVNLQETNLLYQASYQIAQAENNEQVFQLALQALSQTQFSSALLIPAPESLRAFLSGSLSNGGAGEAAAVAVSPADFEKLFLQSKPGLGSGSAPVLVKGLNSHPTLTSGGIELPPNRMPEQMLLWLRTLQCETAALLPVIRRGHLAAALVLGSQSKGGEGQGTAPNLSAAALQPYANLAELTTTTLEKIAALDDIQKRLVQLQTLSNVSQAVSMETDLDSLYRVLHEQITGFMGRVSFLVALYDADDQMVSIPYLVDEGSERLQVDPYPLGEGLVSHLLQTRQPLILLENVVEQSQAMGMKIVGAAPKSWLGVPLMVGGEAIGALVVQDTLHENRFTENDRQLLITLASQVAIAIRNARLLEASLNQAERERQLFDITSKIRRSTDMGSILETTARELGTLLGARRARIEVKVSPAEPTNGPGTNGHSKQQGKGAPEAGR